MTQQGYRPGEESVQWWKVAHHLDEAQLASVTAMASNVDDPSIIFAFQETIRQAQAILLEIFRAKGLLPAAIAPPAAAIAPIDLGDAALMSPSMPPPGMSMPKPPPGMAMPPGMVSPSGMSMPMPPAGMSIAMPPTGMPMPPMMAEAFDPFDPLPDQEAALEETPVEISQADPGQDHVPASIAGPDVTAVTPEVAVQAVDVPEAEA